MQTLVVDELDQDEGWLEKYADKISAFNTEEPLLLVLDTNGGALYIADFIYRRALQFKVHIEVYTARSCGLTLLDKLHSHAETIHISDTCNALAHLPGVSITLLEGGILGRPEERYAVGKSDETKTEIPSVLNEEQKEIYLKGDEVDILASQMKKHYSK